MMIQMRNYILYLIFLVFCPSFIVANNSVDHFFGVMSTEKERDKGLIDQVKEIIRDPFSTSMKLIQDSKENIGSVIPGIDEDTDVEGVPDFILKGLMISDSDAIVLIEIEERSYVLRENDTLSLQNAGSRLVLQVHDISRHSVQIKIGESGSIIIIK